jgi:hypothetical protein
VKKTVDVKRLKHQLWYHMEDKFDQNKGTDAEMNNEQDLLDARDQDKENCNGDELSFGTLMSDMYFK